jgi:hypothetical protein
MTRRAAAEAVSPALAQLRAENHQLRQMAARSQNAEIQRVLDARLPGWRATYADPRFSQWLAQPDDYSGAVRSQLLRNAVSNGDAGRVAAIYQGFQQEAGQYAPVGQHRAYQSRQPASGGARVYSREQIKRLYDQRRAGAIPDSKWAAIENDIVKAGAEGRVVGALNLTDGTALSRVTR